MTSKERVLTALAHKTPDRCPVDVMLEWSTAARLMKEFGFTSEEQLYDLLESDLQFVFPATTSTPEYLPDGSWYDRMGLHAHNVSNAFTTYAEIASNPLADAETVGDLAAYTRYPTTADLLWDTLRPAAEHVQKKRAVKLHTGGMFELIRDYRGYEQILVDMVCNPEMVHYLMNRICDYWCTYVEEAMAAASDLIDIVYTYDDIASQNGLLISPAMLEEFIFPYHRRLNSVIKKYGKPILFHSCGAVSDVIDGLISLPIDILTPLQPNARGMDHAAVKAKYGSRLCFHGAIDIQDTLPRGSADDVRAAVRHAIAVLGQNGGYILCAAHYIQNDTPTQNILAMYDPAIR